MTRRGFFRRNFSHALPILVVWQLAARLWNRCTQPHRPPRFFPTRTGEVDAGILVPSKSAHPTVWVSTEHLDHTAGFFATLKLYIIP